ncbi:S8 family serine peptidase [Streptomyces sp. NPDC048290]|uniref:S8 family serine peptidase n=1 Tax=Streptomyces sp. NPDC048290 TaxID=3155811 RepID=UPI00343B2322
MRDRRRLGPLGCLVALLTALATVLAAAPAAATSPADLPPVTQTLPPGADECARRSPLSTDQLPWAQRYLRPEKVWPLTRGDGVTVAVLGSGVDDRAEALSGRLDLGPKAHGGGNSGDDCVGHGTFTAGLIAAARRADAGFAGLAPEARVLAVSVTDGLGDTDARLLAKGIDAALDAGVAVIALAVGTPTPSDALKAAVARAERDGVPVVAPAAPDASGRDADTYYPAAYPYVLSVTAVDEAGAPPPAGTGGGGAPVDLAAPGLGVVSIGPGAGGHLVGGGPSAAAALVAGTAALVRARHPELDAPRLVHRLLATASHTGGIQPDPFLGYGIVDPVAAVTAHLPEERGAVVDTPQGARPSALPPLPDRSARGESLAVVAVGAAVVFLVGVAIMVAPRGARRRWRGGGVWSDGPS